MAGATSITCTEERKLAHDRAITLNIEISTVRPHFYGLARLGLSWINARSNTTYYARVFFFFLLLLFFSFFSSSGGIFPAPFRSIYRRDSTGRDYEVDVWVVYEWLNRKLRWITICGCVVVNGGGGGALLFQDSWTRYANRGWVEAGGLDSNWMLEVVLKIYGKCYISLYREFWYRYLRIVKRVVRRLYWDY